MNFNARAEGKSTALFVVALAGACFTSLAGAQVQRSFINLGFEQPTLTAAVPATGCYVQIAESGVPGWTSNHASTTGSGDCTSPTANTGALIELWRTNFLGVPAREGVNFAELNAQQASRLFQNICVTNGEQVRWQLSHRGRSGTDVMSFNVDSSSNQIMRGSTNTSGAGSVAAGSCGTGNVTSATCNAPTTTSTWADYGGTFTWNGTTGVHSFGFEAIGGSTVGNLLDRIQVFLTPYVELLPSSNSGRESSGAVNTPALVVTGNVTAAFTVSLQIDPSSTAVLGTDFTTPGGGNTFTVTVPAGNYDGGAGSRFNVGINLIDNAVIENNRTIVLTVQPQPANYTIANSQTCGGAATATLTYTILDDDVDLRTTKSASTAVPVPGAPFTYTVTYANNTARTTLAPQTAHDVTAPISDAVPAGLTFTSWTCQASGGASCPGGAVNGSTSGSGALSGNAFLPAGNAAAGGSITYTINAVAGGAPNCAAIRNTSAITTPSPFAEGTSVRSGFVSPAPGGTANNSAAVDVDPVCASTLTLNKVTLGAAAGPFGFALTNTTQASGAATTAAAGTPAQVDGDPAAGVQPFTIPSAGIGAPVTLQESSGPAGWGVQSAACTVGGTPVGAFAGGVLTIPGASVVENANYVCTFTNTRPRIRLQKALPDGRVLAGDQFLLTIAGPRGGAATTATATTTGSGNVATGVADFNPADSGGTYTLSEAAAGSTILGLYNPSISCSNATSGSATPLPSGAGASFSLTPAANDDITCTISNPKRPPTTVQITKISNGGVGAFTFSGNNGFANQTITTTAPGTGVSAPAQTLTAGLTATTITEAAPPAGFALTSIACSGLGAGGTATPTIAGNGSGGGSVVLNAAATAPGSNIQCTFTNTRRTLTLAKAWAGAKLNDAVTVSTTGLANNATLAAVANTANETDTGTAVAVFAGETATIAETFTTGTAADYTATLSCTGAADANPNDGLTIGSADTAIVCTQTNTRKTQPFNLAKTWVNGGSGHTATATTTGGSATATFSATAPTNAAGAVVNLRAGDQITLPAETFGGGATAAMYTTTVACTGGTTLAAAAPPQTITIASNTTATTCTYTNTRRRADLSISKTDGATTYTPGTPITYTIVARNAGPGAATGAVVSDTLPASITGAAWTVAYAGGATGPAGGSGNINATVNLPVNATATFTVTGTIAANASGDLVNTATIAAPTDLQDPDTSNNSATDTNTRAGRADIEVVKTGTASAGYGGALSYNIVITNHGPSDAGGTTYSDTLPAGVTNVAAVCGAVTGGAVCTAPTVAGNAVTGTIATLPANGSVTITVTGNAPTSGTSVTNSATAQPPSGTTDPTPGNNTGTATTTLLQPQLGVTKTATPNPFTVGQPASYTITVANNGAGPTAGNITITDPLPAGSALTGFSGANWSCTGTTAVSCVYSGTLAAGASTTLTLNVSVASSAANADNSATASGGGDSGCPAAGRCTGTVVVPVNASADIAVTKTVDNATPNVGETVTFTITASNDGPSDATGVAITDALPSGLVFVSATASQGSYDDATGLWSVGALANGADATLAITASVLTPGAITNTATKSAGDQFDPNTGNNAGSASINGQPSADLQVTKTVDVAAPNLGSNVTFTITVHNAGPNDASGVVIDDLLPAGLDFVSASPTPGSYDDVAGTWTIGALANGADATLTIIATVTQAGDLTNTASVAASDQHDPNPANNSGGVTINGQSADIQVLKTVDDANPVRGDTITFTVTATNLGPSAATGVELTDALPAGLTFVSATPSQGSYDDVSGIWTIGDLAASGAGATVTLTITATVDTDAAATNTANLSALDQTDPNPANNSAAATLTPLASADLAVVKTGPASATPGTQVTYTLQVSNAGPSPASAVSLDDPTPAGLTFVSAAAPCAGGFPCTLGDLASGASVSVTVTFSVPANFSGSISNTATVGSPTGDPTPGNNTSTVTTPTTASADLAVVKTGPASAVPGATVTYTLAVSNNGPSDAAAVSLNDPTPAGLTFVSADAPCAGGFPCALGTLASGASASVTVTFSIPANFAGPLSNTATVTSPTSDPTPGNNSSTITTPLAPSADLAVAKTGPATVTAGGAISYSVVVTNNGPSDANGASFSDPVPAGISGVTASCGSASGGAVCGAVNVAGNNVTSTITTLPSGGSVTFTINGTAPANAASLGNTATIAPPSGTTDPNNANDTSTATTTVAASANLAVLKTGPATAVPGTNLTYTLQVGNAGPSVATAVSLDDPTPAGLTFVSAGAPCAAGFPCNLGDLAAGASVTVTVTFAVPANATGSIANTATVTSPTPDPTPGDNTSTVTTPTAPSADLAVLKTGPADVGFGGALSYTVVVTNNGPSDANGASFSDAVPAGVTGVAASCGAPTGGAVCGAVNVAGNNVTSTITTLPSGGSVTITITGTAPTSGTSIANTATIAPPSGVTDPTAPNNSSTATTNLLQPQLTVTKSATPNPFVVGQPASYTITVQNTGAGPTSGNVTLADTLPTGVGLISATGTDWTCSGAPALSCTFSGTLAAGASTTLTLNVSIAAGTSNADNSATASGGGDSGCPAAGRCTGTVVVPVNASADIAVTKTVDNATPNVGETVTFTITASNDGPSDATGVAITDALPSGLVFVSATASQGSYDDATGLWSVGALANGANATLDITATVIATGSLTNTATRTGGDQLDPDPSNNSGSAGVNGQPSADLQVQKTVDDAVPNVGSNVVFTVTLTNGGPNDATGVTLDDLLPAGLGFVSALPSQGSYDDATGVWTVGALADGAAATLTITATVTQAGDITNIAAVGSSDQHDPNPANNSGGVTINGQSADIQVIKTVDDANPTVGDTITFTITTTNNGPSAATGVEVTETLPSQLSLVSATPSQGAYAAATGVWTIGNLAASGPGATVTLTIVATVVADGAFTNTVAVSASDQPDPVPSNNTAEVPILGIASADLEVLKAGPANATAGQNVSYALTVTNHGPSEAAAVSLDDPTPAGLSFVSADVPCAGGFPCALGDLAAGASVTVNATFAVPSNYAGADPIANTATVSSPTGDPDTDNNTSTATTPLIRSADVSVTKTGPATVTAAGAITYTIVVSNAGPSDADGTGVSDPLPAGLSNAAASCAGETGGALCGAFDTTVAGTITTLPAGGSATITITATAPNDAAALSNTASVTPPSGVTDPDTGNNQDTAETTVNASANLSVAKTGPATATPGTQATYQIVVRNAGPSTATAVSLADPTPAGLTFVAADAPCAAGFPCALGDLAAGASVTVNVTYAIPSGQSGSIANTATVSSPTGDADPSDNTSTATTTLSGNADLQISKSGPATVTAAGTITYTLVVSNAGPSDADGTSVSDPLPAGLSNANASCAGETGGAVCGAFDTTVAGTITTLPAGGSATITITATAPNDAAALSNTASVTPPTGVTDPVPGNNQSTVGTTVEASANLSMTKSGPATVTSGGAISYTLVIANAGPSAANGATYSDAVPAGITDVAASCGAAAGGAVCANPNVAGNTVSGTVPTLPANGSVTITITGTAPIGAQTLTNTASVVPPAGTTDPDPSDDTDEVSTEVGSAADLVVDKTVDEASPNVGENVTFTVTVSNDGPNDATGVQITDGLPPGLVFVSAAPSQGAYANATGLWDVGALANGANATLTITATVTQPGAIVNTATVTSSDQLDPDTSNNADSEALNGGLLADVQVNKTADTLTPNQGSNVTFTITVRNAGPSPATDVNVTDLLPAGLSFVSATPSLGAYDDVTGLWTVGDLAAGAEQTLAIVATVTQAGEITNTATGAANEPDPNPANNQSGVTPNGQAADLQVVKTVDNANPLLGQDVTFTVTLSNLGPNAATGVRVNDALPAGLTFVSANPSQGTYDQTSGLWTVGDLAASGAGAVATLQITTTVTQTGAITNVAISAGGDQTDPTPSNDEGGATVTVPASVDVSISKSGPATVGAGGTISYTLVVANAGPDAANGTTYSDDVPAGITGISASCGTPVGGAVCADPVVAGTAVSGTVPALPANGSVTITISGTAPADATTLTNTATVTPPAGSDDPTPSNDTSPPVETEVTPVADLSVTKAGPAAVAAGGTITYTLVVSNAGPSRADGATVSDPLPAGLSNATASCGNETGGAACGAFDTSVAGTIATLPAGGSATITITATAPTQAATLSNTATVAPPAGVSDPEPGNDDSAAVVTTIGEPIADLSVRKSGPASVVAGTTLVYTVVVTNAGPNTAVAVSLADPTPAGLVFVSNSGGCATTYPCALGDLASGASATVTSTYEVPLDYAGPNPIANTASVSSATADPTAADNSATAQTTVDTSGQVSDMMATGAPTQTVPVGTPVTVVTTCTNNGPLAALDATCSVQEPVGPTAAAAVLATECTPTLPVASLAVGGAITCTTQFTPTQPGTWTLQTTAASRTPDSIPSNNVAPSVVIALAPDAADLAVSKQGPPTATAGGNIVYTLSVTNLGPAAANDVALNDPTPAGLTFVSADAPCAGGFPCQLGTLASGQTATFTATYAVAANFRGSITNTATASSSTGDPNPANNGGAATTTVSGGEPVPARPVPVDARWMLALMSLLLTLVAGIGLRRRRG